MKAGAWRYQERVEGGALRRRESADHNLERGEGSQSSPLQDEDEAKETKSTKDFVESYDQ